MVRSAAAGGAVGVSRLRSGVGGHTDIASTLSLLIASIELTQLLLISLQWLAVPIVSTER